MYISSIRNRWVDLQTVIFLLYGDESFQLSWNISYPRDPDEAPYINLTTRPKFSNIEASVETT